MSNEQCETKMLGSERNYSFKDNPTLNIVSRHGHSRKPYRIHTFERELSVFEALMCFFTIGTKYNAPLASVNGDSDDDRYDIVGCGAAGQPATGPLRSATRL